MICELKQDTVLNSVASIGLKLWYDTCFMLATGPFLAEWCMHLGISPIKMSILHIARDMLLH